MKKILISILFANIFITPSFSMTDHEADCSIWLCLPSGFPQGCSPALSKFKKRIKKGRSPLPNFSSCLATPSKDLAIDYSTPEEPYQLKISYAVYINDGKSVKISNSYNPMTRQCPRNGEIITQRRYTRGSSDIIETWLSAICSRVTEYGTTMNDYKYPYVSAGKPLEVTQGPFKPKLLRRSSSSNR